MEDQRLPPQHAKPDVPVVRTPDVWPHAATYWFLVLEAQFRVHRINRQDVPVEQSYERQQSSRESQS